jgi:hypothetical protein
VEGIGSPVCSVLLGQAHAMHRRGPSFRVTCPAKAYQVEVEEMACVVRLRPEIPAFFALDRLKGVAPMNYPLLAFSARPDLVPDGAPRSLPTGLRMSQAGDQPVHCVAAPGCNPGASARACHVRRRA